MRQKQHYYGGQAVLEGVMMRGADLWAIAVRRPDGTIHCESHQIDSIAKRLPILKKPLLRGVIALGQAFAIGFRALLISANQSVEEEEQLTRGQMAASMIVAGVFFIAVFIVGPAILFSLLEERVGGGLVARMLEGVTRVLLFLGYLLLIGAMKEVRRLFQYHGAEHKTIAAYEHDDPLAPETVDKYSTLHVRCGTNFVLIVMVLTIFIYALFGSPGLWLVIAYRILAIPIIAGIAFEALRIGARFPRSRFVRALMAPGLWLQKITTKPPTSDQIEVAIASFEEVLRRERELGEPPTTEGPVPLPADEPER